MFTLTLPKFPRHYKKNIFLLWVRFAFFTLILLLIGGAAYLFGAQGTDPSRINELTEENQQLTTENSQLTNENNQLTTENSQLTNENNQLTNENNQLTTENSQLTNENNQLTTENSQLTNENNQLTTEKETLINRNQRLTEQLPQGISKQILDSVRQCESLETQQLQKNETEGRLVANMAWDNDLLNLRLVEQITPHDDEPIQKNIRVNIRFSDQNTKRFVQTTPIFEWIRADEHEYLLKIQTLNDSQNTQNSLEVQVKKCPTVFDHLFD